MTNAKQALLACLGILVASVSLIASREDPLSSFLPSSYVMPVRNWGALRRFWSRIDGWSGSDLDSHFGGGASKKDTRQSVGLIQLDAAGCQNSIRV